MLLDLSSLTDFAVHHPYRSSIISAVTSLALNWLRKQKPLTWLREHKPLTWIKTKAPELAETLKVVIKSKDDVLEELHQSKLRKISRKASLPTSQRNQGASPWAQRSAPPTPLAADSGDTRLDSLELPDPLLLSHSSDDSDDGVAKRA